MKAKTYYHKCLSVTILVVTALGLSQKASATGLGVASDYNVFTIRNINQQSTDIEGKLAAGGNVNFVGGIGSKLATNSGNVVVAGNNLTLSNGQVSNGNAVYGVSANIASNEGLPNGKLSQGNPIDFNAAGTQLESLSQSLASLTPNGTTTVNKWGDINLTGSDSQLNVFNLDGSALSKTNNFTINSNSGSTVIVNVSGTNVSLSNFGFNISGTNQQHILYNFYQATTLTASGVGIQGSILAPLANFTFNNGQVNGNMVVASLSGKGEFHNYLFQGNLPSTQGTSTPKKPTTQDTSTPKKVPEPANLVGLGLIAAILGLSRSRGSSARLCTLAALP